MKDRIEICGMYQTSGKCSRLFPTYLDVNGKRCYHEVIPFDKTSFLKLVGQVWDRIKKVYTNKRIKIIISIETYEDNCKV